MPFRSVVAALGICSFSVTSHAVPRLIALSGQSAPDTAEASYWQFSTVSIADDGGVSFWASLQGASSISNQAIYRYSPDSVIKLQQKGDEAPQTAGALIDLLGAPTVGADGTYAFSMRLRREGAVTLDNDWGLWADFGAGVELVAREGGAAPDADGALFTRPGREVVGASGDLVFVSDFKQVGGVTDANDSGLWRRLSGAAGLELIARKGDAAPGVSGASFGFLGTPAVNAGGEVAFFSRLVADPDRGGVDATNDASIWKTSGGTPQLVVREGEPSPVPGMAYGNFFSRPLLNAGGELLFTATLSHGDSIDFDNDGLLIRHSGASATLLAREGEPAIGTPGRTWGNFNYMAFNDAGHVAIGATTQSDEARGSDAEFGIWADFGDGLSAIALTGLAAPGAPGARFGEMGAPIINERGDLVFQATLLIEGDVTFDNGRGIWALYSASSELINVIRAGDIIRVGPGDFRTVDFFSVEGTDTEAFEPTQALNASGLLGLSVGFTDGSEAVYAYQIPAPGSAATFMMAMLIAARRRRCA